jgi:beta-glucosidase
MITDLLKGMYGFQGVAMTDWNAQAAAGGYDAVVNAGIDMLMQPSAWQDAVNAIASSGNIPDSRIDDAVTRILNVKCQAGLFNFKRDPSLLASVGSADHRAVGRKAVAESLVVLQNNNNVLPLKKGSKIWVGGGGANSLAIQCGGWTINWQGAGDQTQGTTVVQAIGKDTTLAQDMNSADALVVVLGEAPHAETPGDSQTINTIPAGDFSTLQQAHATGKPVVAIVMSGRPVAIADNIGNADAWIAAWLPGTEGDGIADILFGDVKPTGKLSHSWTRDDSQDNLMTCCNGAYNPLFPLGFGLTY